MLEVPEIRINENYTQLLHSDYNDDNYELDGESTPIIRNSLKRTNDFLYKMNPKSNSSLILPSNCRYYEEFSGDKKLFIIEEPPAYRTVSVNLSMEYELSMLSAYGKIEEYGINEDDYHYTKRPYRFTLAFPYTIFIILTDGNRLQNGYVFLRKGKIRGLSDYLIKMPMCNINGNQAVCFGEKAKGTFDNVNQVVENTIMVFWSAEFNTDYRYNHEAYKNTAGVSSYIEWQALSQKDPMFIYNVDWIQFDYNLNDVLEDIKRGSSLKPFSNITFSNLKRLFTKPAKLPHDNLEDNDIYSELYFDIAEGIKLPENIYLHCGDPIMWGKNRVFIDSFIGYYGYGEITKARIQFEDETRIIIKLTEPVLKYLSTQIRDTAFKKFAVLKNGVEVKHNDIIKVTPPGGKTIYKRILDLRETADGKTEAKIGTSFYIVENLEGEIYDINTSDIEYQGVRLIRDKQYFIVDNSRRSSNFTITKLYKFNGVDVDNFYGSGLVLLFNDVDNDENKVTLNFNDKNIYSSQKYIIPLDECVQMPHIFAYNRRLFKSDDRRVYSSLKYGMLIKSSSSYSYSEYDLTADVNLREVVNKILINDSQTLNIQGINYNTIYNIGDKVVWADWNQPANMLIPKTIDSFVVDNALKTINVVLKDKENNLTQIPFVKVSSYSASVQSGSLRHITNRYGTLTSGMKIKAKESNVRNFPKKDVNIIVGFLTDTGIEEPLVLCSNCLTLWYNDVIEKFDIILTTDVKWKKLNHVAIDLSNIKIQAGDVLENEDSTTSCGFLISYVPSYTRLRMTNLMQINNNSSLSPDKNRLKHMKFSTFLSPRELIVNINNRSRIRGDFNFNGVVYKNEFSRYSFLENERNI